MMRCVNKGNLGPHKEARALTCRLFNVPLKLAFDESISARVRFSGSLKYVCAIADCGRMSG